MIAESLARHGSWFFRWRSYVLLGFVPLILLAIAGPEPIEATFGEFVDSSYEAFCIAIACSGLMIRALTVGFVPSGTSGRNTHRQIADALNTTGIYSLTRNPLYLGNAVSIMGIALFTQSLTVILVMLLFLVIYLERIIAAEEAYLSAKFGDAYLDWARRVPVFLPGLGGWQRPSLPLSLRTVLRREHSSMLAVLAPLFVIDQARDVIAARAMVVDTAWLAAFATALALYLTLVWMKKRTRLLHVPGR